MHFLTTIKLNLVPMLIRGFQINFYCKFGDLLGMRFLCYNFPFYIFYLILTTFKLCAMYLYVNFYTSYLTFFQFKGTVSREIRWVFIVINQRLFTRAIITHHKIFISLKGHFTKENPAYNSSSSG